MTTKMINRISPLTLGTVQLGMDYGIANPEGKPNSIVGAQILKGAAELGVTAWDTSRHYGVSEEVIGAFLATDRSCHPCIISKFKWSAAALENEELARREALTQLKTSLRVLGQDSLPLILYHTDKDQAIEKVMRILPKVLKSLREDGLIEGGGISLYYPQDAMAILDEPEIMATQLAVNVFDQRLLLDNTMQRLADAEKIVFARSVFLQGLFFLGKDNLPHSLKEAASYIDELRNLAEKVEMTVAQFAFSYVRDIVGVSSIVFGAENAAQVAQNVQLLNGLPILGEWREKAQSLFRNVPEKIVTPGLWNT